MSTLQAVKTKEGPALKLGDRLDIVKNMRFFQLAFPLSMLVVIIIAFSVLTEGAFLSKTVFQGLFNQSLIVGTMATAVSFIYSTGNIDFSVGNAMGLATVFGAMVYQRTESMVSFLLVTMVCGILLMLCNCTLGVVFKLQSAMVAVVAMSVYNALTIVLVGANPYRIDYQSAKGLEGNFRYITFLAYFVLCLVMYHKTAIGRKLRFIGGNQKCAEQTGISNKKSLYTAFLFAGIGVGLAGVFQTLRTGNVAQGVGNGMGMDVMLATVLGGMSIFGGTKSNAYAGFIGAVTVTALNKGLLMVGVSSTMIQGVRGVIFLLLVFLNSERQNSLPSRQQF